MAIYHFSAKVLSKNAGRSCVQFSAYMAGAKDKNEVTGETYDKTSKEEVTLSDMYFADCVPVEMRTIHSFWNGVEKFEKADNARLARTFEVALPNEFNAVENEELIRKFAKSLIEDGLPAVQLAIHDKAGNKHSHLMVPVRTMDESGKWQTKGKKGYVYEDGKGNKTICSAKEAEEYLDLNEWHRIPILDKNGKQKTDKRNRLQWEREYIEDNPFDRVEQLKIWRTRWADICNEAIKEHNLLKNDNIEQISEKTLKEQGINRIPTLHEGYWARRLEAEGGISEICERNREIQAVNELTAEIEVLRKDIIRQESLIRWLQEQLKKFLEEMSHVATNVRNFITGNTEEDPEERRKRRREALLGGSTEETIFLNTEDIIDAASIDSGAEEEEEESEEKEEISGDDWLTDDE